MTDFVRAEKLANGNLRLVLHDDAREDLLELKRRMDEGDNFSTGDAEAEVLEHLIGNGWSNVAPAQVGALTDAPMISDECEYPDDGDPTVNPGGHVYAYMAYEIRSFVDDLAENGEAIFQGAVVEKS